VVGGDVREGIESALDHEAARAPVRRERDGDRAAERLAEQHDLAWRHPRALLEPSSRRPRVRDDVLAAR
jgi:hypothetical protein